MSLLRWLLVPMACFAATCSDLLAVSSAEAATLVSDEHVKVAADCVKDLVQLGYWDAALALITTLGEKPLGQKEVVRRLAVDSKKKVEKFVASLEPKTRAQVVFPAIQWAQSPSKVFLEVKFAHRFDSPGCLEVQDPKVTFTDTQLKFSGTCTMSGQKINYVVDTELYDEINPKESTYSFASVGRLTINLAKKEKSAWTSPMKGKKPSNLQVWWDMKERYRKEMNEYTGEEDEEAATRTKTDL